MVRTRRMSISACDLLEPIVVPQPIQQANSAPAEFFGSTPTELTGGSSSGPLSPDGVESSQAQSAAISQSAKKLCRFESGTESPRPSRVMNHKKARISPAIKEKAALARVLVSRPSFPLDLPFTVPEASEETAAAEEAPSRKRSRRSSMRFEPEAPERQSAADGHHSISPEPSRKRSRRSSMRFELGTK